MADVLRESLGAAAAIPKSMGTKLEYRRLPQDIQPTHYAISILGLHLARDDWTYTGRVEIELRVQRSTDCIVLNAHKIRNITASLSGHCDAAVSHISQDETTQRLVIHLSQELKASYSPVHISLTYEATIDGHLTGFYRSQEDSTSGIGEGGERSQHVFCTQFQPSDARCAFPCFDEPGFKATFDLSIEVPKSLTVLSNMPVKSSIPSEDDAARKVVSFERTPVMSTYLVAWAIGKLSCIETVIARRYSNVPLPIRVYTRPDLLQQGRFALDFAGRVMDYFAKIFGIDYPLPKLDLLAVTEMSDDAMENWGLVIFRSTALLLDETRPDPALCTRVAYIIAHELAHQWFGNLVTMEWWDELWLNEGFATWAGWDACDFLYPEWDVWGQFVAEDMQEAFELDSLPSSHPVEVPVLDGLEVDSIFDSISYLKGASMIRMLITYIGREAFLQGIHSYLSAHVHQNTTADSLWSALEDASGEAVALLIQPWIKTMGFPVVSVQQMDDRTILLQQSPIIPPSKQSWIVPLSIETLSGTVKHNLETSSSRLNVHAGPIKFNVDHQGFYRTHLADDMLLRMSVFPANLSTRDQAGFLGDAMAMAFIGRGTSTLTIMTVIENLSANADFVVWTSMLSCLKQIRSTFSSDKEIDNGLCSFTRKLVKSKVDVLEWHPDAAESYSTQRLRPLLLSAAGLAGDDQVIDKAHQVFEAVRSGDENDVHPQLRETIFIIAVSKIGIDAVAFLQELYQKTKSPHEREAIAHAMGQLSNPDEARNCLLSNFSGSMAAQDLRTLAVAMAQNPAIPGVMWRFLREHWSSVCERLAGSMAIFEPFIRGCLRPLTSLEDAGEVELFFADKDTLGYQRGLTVAIDTIKANAAYRSRDVEVVRKWLRSIYRSNKQA